MEADEGVWSFCHEFDEGVCWVDAGFVGAIFKLCGTFDWEEGALFLVDEKALVSAEWGAFQEWFFVWGRAAAGEVWGELVGGEDLDFLVFFTQDDFHWAAVFLHCAKPVLE